MRPSSPQATSALRCARSRQRFSPRAAAATAPTALISSSIEATTPHRRRESSPFAFASRSIITRAAAPAASTLPADSRTRSGRPERSSTPSSLGCPSLSTRTGPTSSTLTNPAGSQKSLTQQPIRHAQPCATVTVSAPPPDVPQGEELSVPYIDTRLLALGFSLSTSPVNTGNPSAIVWDSASPTPALPASVLPQEPSKTLPNVTEYLYAPFSTSLVNTGNPAFWDSLVEEEEPTPQKIAEKSSNSRVTMAPPPPPPASDEDYAAFLEKADADRQGSSVQSQSKKGDFTQQSVESGSAVPASIKSLGERYYMSESDERFEPVALSAPHGTKSVSVDLVKQITGYDKVEDVKIQTFDARGDYSDVVQAVEKAIGGQPKVFRVSLSGARYEYWILGLEQENERVVGLRVGAVES